jgi:hypothetical protein
LGVKGDAQEEEGGKEGGKTAREEIVVYSI